jgi:hypothetical protein
VKRAPFAAERLLEHIRLDVGNGAKPLDAGGLLQQLLLLDRIGSRVDDARLLGGNGGRDRGEAQDSDCRGEKPNTDAELRHAALLCLHG